MRIIGPVIVAGLLLFFVHTYFDSKEYPRDEPKSVSNVVANDDYKKTIKMEEEIEKVQEKIPPSEDINDSGKDKTKEGLDIHITTESLIESMREYLESENNSGLSTGKVYHAPSRRTTARQKYFHDTTGQEYFSEEVPDWLMASTQDNWDRAANTVSISSKKAAAYLGNTEAQYDLGYMYEHGIDNEGRGLIVSKSLSKAKYWYKKACENGLKVACEALEKLGR